jgi:hypothetical protein
MNMKRTVKIVLTDFFRWIGRLYSSLRMWVHVLFLQSALVCKLVKDLLQLDALPHRIGFAQKRVVNRRWHNRKGALFTAVPDGLLDYLGNGPPSIGIRSQPARSATRQPII